MKNDKKCYENEWKRLPMHQIYYKAFVISELKGDHIIERFSLDIMCLIL